MSIRTVKIDFDGKEYSLETGRFAKFASGAVMVRCGDTMVLVTAVASENELKDVDFLPLQVEYREKISAVGKIPGGFLKREGRPTDKEILSARLIDRPIRPMIPKTWHFETQIIATVFSAEPDVNPDTLAAVGASAALLISDIPFHGPISEVRIGRVNGEFIVNPSLEQLEKSDMDITVAGTSQAITMVEGESKEISEEDFVAALMFAHEKIKILNQLQLQLAEQMEVTKREYTIEEIPEEIVKTIEEALYEEINQYVHSQSSKSERREKRNEIYEKALALVNEKFGENEELQPQLERYTGNIVSDIEKKLMRRMIVEENRRLDGRSTTDIRPISCEVGLLPRTHGSSLFTRGETQSLSTVTLGTNRDEQLIEGLEPVRTERFMLHYNFPPFSTGEVGRLGTSRREIGHGHLAWRALKEMLPAQEEFPYTIRVVSDILESNGSSSMATVCAGSLALFDAGVPMKKPVAGIAMGLIKEDDKVAVLSDILGDEDFLGDMDFKVAGTYDGITACQMDIKIEGLSVEIMRQALEQARKGRFHILGIMNEVISEPRPDLSPYAPRFTAIKIPTDMIGAVIGPGGEVIRSICRETNTEINIEDDGTVLIAATNSQSAEEATKMIQSLVQKPVEGEIYKGTVKEVREGLGAIVEFLPKTQGLLHISQIAHERVTNLKDFVKVGDKFEVKLIEISPDGKYRLSRKALLPIPAKQPLVKKDIPSKNNDKSR
ncbi:MAG TPA: polyribonucleotide nucleotidyltransferase [Candidatus Kapabacteria bacterium]|jgi:polyribonucleotide nucleotidyltransferase|nr:polyribonucleotide nucleotidyltransferase [Candidatus Kapabacteria bacterium]HPP39225.1 polyribonucleotide nucleotidyltransferase [Candidatus Kapabacteria bacterium]HPU22888.1 polyribonucleotide nucleotidyltransferase [Candidatus Kapabacteria bacterium]